MKLLAVKKSQLTKQQLVSALVGLKETNSGRVLDIPGFLDDELCERGDIPLVRRMFEIISELLDSFDYSESPEFLRSLVGRTPEFCAMKLKLITPMRRTETLKRLGDALADITASDAALDLVECSRHERIKELRTLLAEVSNANEQNA